MWWDDAMLRVLLRHITDSLGYIFCLFFLFFGFSQGVNSTLEDFLLL